MGHLLDRRTFLSLGGGTAIAAAASPRLWGLGAIPAPAAKDEVESKLDAFTAAYMKAMNAPGMTQALTDKTATIRTAGYGFANLELKTPVSPDQFFQIGSITKSFTALIMLQLRDEGKVDLHRPVLEYLPWLPVNMPYGPITAHHLLTHSSGLPDASAIFQSDPAARHVQGFAPGAHFSPLRCPGFPVEVGGVGKHHAPFLRERRTRGPIQRSVAGNPGTLRSR